MQIKTLKAMLDRVSAAYTGWSSAPSGNFGIPANVKAVDSSASKVELVWSGVAGAAGYNIYRASCSGCAFNKLNATPVKGKSYADYGLAASKTYSYTVRAVNASGLESADSAVAGSTTAATPPYCGPYLASNYDHWLANRAYVPWYNAYIILANGSGSYLGATGPLSMTTFTFLRQSSTGYFQIGACP